MTETTDVETEAEVADSGDGVVGELSRTIEELDVRELVDGAVRWVRDHPLLAVTGAAGVGLVVGLALRSGPSRRGGGRSRGTLRQAFSEVGRELEDRAEGWRSAASGQLAAVATSVVDPLKERVGGTIQGASSISDTLKTVFASLALKKVAEWLGGRS